MKTIWVLNFNQQWQFSKLQYWFLWVFMHLTFLLDSRCLWILFHQSVKLQRNFLDVAFFFVANDFVIMPVVFLAFLWAVTHFVASAAILEFCIIDLMGSVDFIYLILLGWSIGSCMGASFLPCSFITVFPQLAFLFLLPLGYLCVDVDWQRLSRITPPTALVSFVAKNRSIHLLGHPVCVDFSFYFFLESICPVIFIQTPIYLHSHKIYNYLYINIFCLSIFTQFYSYLSMCISLWYHIFTYTYLFTYLSRPGLCWLCGGRGLRLLLLQGAGGGVHQLRQGNLFF